jgi:hypothetical protein
MRCARCAGSVHPCTCTTHSVTGASIITQPSREADSPTAALQQAHHSRLKVNTGSCLISCKDFWLAQQSTCNTHKLPLAHTEVLSCVTKAGDRNRKHVHVWHVM